MPPVRRSTRAGSVEPTRTSRRLRSRQDPDDSPLKALEAPSRRKRTASATQADQSTLYIPTNQAETTTSEEEHVATSEEEHIATCEEENVARRDKETAAGVSEWQARVLTLLRRNLARSNAQNNRHLTYSELILLVNFENAHDFFTTFEILHNSDVHAALRQRVHDMTDDELTKLAIRQLGQIVSSKDRTNHLQQFVQDATSQRDAVQEQLADAQQEIRELQERLQEKERLVDHKRSAPSEDENEDADADEQRSARRVKLTPASRQSATPKSATPITSHNTSSPLAMTNTKRHSLSSPLALTNATRQSLSSPLAIANANRQSPYKIPLMVDADNEDEEEGDISFYPTQGRPSPSPPKNKFESFVARRLREKERQRREHEWLGAALKDPELELPNEADADMSSNEDEDEYRNQSAVADNQMVTHTPNASRSTNNGLTPIREESEPATPSVRRWGLSSLLAPVTRLLGGTPRTEPARHISQTHPVGTSAPTSTPSDSHSQSRRVSSGKSSSSRRTTYSQQDEEPVTPTPNYGAGITAASFLPQSAPQARSAPQAVIGGSARRRMSHADRIKLYDAGVARRKKAENERLQAAELARYAAIEAEDKRLKAEARVVRAELDAQKTGEKRKVRVDDLATIPNPKKGGYGMEDKYFEEDSDGEVYVDEDVTMADVFTPSPAKKVRFSDSPSEASNQKKPWWQAQADSFNKVSPHIKTPTLLASSNANRAHPYTGTMLADGNKEIKPGGASVNAQSPKKNSQPGFMSPRTYGQKHQVWTGPKATKIDKPANFNWEGHFAVPDDSDTESEGSSLTEPPPSNNNTSDEVPKTPKPKASNDVTTPSAEGDSRTNIFATPSTLDNETGSKNSNDNEQALVPPPPPTPAHAALPGTPTAVPNPNDSDALAKARSQAEKYKPKTPSGLRATSRLSSSPVIPDTGKPAGQANIFGIAPIASVDPAPSLFPQPASANTSDSDGSSEAVTPTNNDQSVAQPEEIPYEQTLAYSTECAKRDAAKPGGPVLLWPAAGRPLFPDRPVTDPVVQAALDEARRQPDWEASCDQAWKEAWDNYQAEKAADPEAMQERIKGWIAKGDAILAGLEAGTHPGGSVST